MEKDFHELHREIWSVLKDEVMKGYAQSTQVRRPADVAPDAAVLQLMVAVVALSLWQFLTTVPVFGKILLPPFFFSNPIDVASQIVKWFTSGVIWKHLMITLWESMLAFVIGSVGGVLVGFWFARQPLVAAVFDPYVKMINALPRVVLAPIFALWLGLGIWSKVALGVTLVFFIVFFNVYQGVKEVSQPCSTTAACSA